MFLESFEWIGHQHGQYSSIRVWQHDPHDRRQHRGSRFDQHLNPVENKKPEICFF